LQAAGASDEDKAMLEEQKKAQAAKHVEDMAKMKEEFEKQLAEMQAAAAAGGGGEEAVTQNDIAKAKEAYAQKESSAEESYQVSTELDGVQKALQQLMRSAPNMSKMCMMLDRPMLGFEVKLSPGENMGDAPEPKVIVRNSDTGEEVIQDPKEFQDRYAIIEQETSSLRGAIEFGTNYDTPECNDPLTLLFDNLFKIGSAHISLMEYAVLMETDTPNVTIRRAVAPFNDVGTLQFMMTPIKGPDNLTPLSDEEVVDDPEELLGKSWSYLLEVKGIEKLALKSDETYVQFSFNGESFGTEVSEVPSNNVRFEFKQVLHCNSVTPEFLKYLDEGEMRMDVFVNPSVTPPVSKVSSSNSNIRKYLSGKGPAEPGSPAGGRVVNMEEEAAHEKAARTQALNHEVQRNKELEAEIELLTKRAAETKANPGIIGQRLAQLEADTNKYQEGFANEAGNGACNMS